jgi:hypothetical protein
MAAQIQEVGSLGPSWRLASIICTSRKCVIFVLLFFSVLGFELRAYTLSHSTSPFLCWIIFEIGSHKLFAWAGFKLRSS